MKNILLILLGIFSFSISKAQDTILKGGRVVVGRFDEGVPGLIITLKGTKLGTMSDGNGFFRLQIPDSVMLDKFELELLAAGCKTTSLDLKKAKFSEDLNYTSSDFTAFSNTINTGDIMSSSYSVSISTFKWPPPAPSTQDIMEKSILGNCKTLGDVDSRLKTTLDQFGYYESSYYQIPGGYSLVTRIERIKEDVPVAYDPPERWDMDIRKSPRSLSEYLAALALVKKGLFRVIIFAVTDAPFASQSNPVNSEDALAWLKNGTSSLPQRISEKKFSTTHYVAVLIYQFQKIEQQAPTFQSTSIFPCREHVNGIYKLLEKTK
jgi:hypothetical protein